MFTAPLLVISKRLSKYPTKLLHNGFLSCLYCIEAPTLCHYELLYCSAVFFQHSASCLFNLRGDFVPIESLSCYSAWTIQTTLSGHHVTCSCMNTMIQMNLHRLSDTLFLQLRCIWSDHNLQTAT